MIESIASVERPNVQTNIFKLMSGEQRVLEDKFTAAWGYLLDREPLLAQAVADIFLKGRGIVAKVVRVTDHPYCNSLKKPDFCIECEGLRILVEHKLEASLHEKQLENYLELCSQNTYIAFVAPSYHTISEQVLTSALYLKPEGKDHFRWSDFHNAVKTHPERLTQEFADFMGSLGMAPYTLKGTKDIFDKREKPEQFDKVLKSAATEVFKKDNPGCTVKSIKSFLGQVIQNPRESITLIYLRAELQSRYVPECNAPVLEINVYEREITEPFPLAESKFTTSSGLQVYRHILAKQMKEGEGISRIMYVAPLVEIIQETPEATVRCLVEMMAVIRADFWPEALIT